MKIQGIYKWGSTNQLDPKYSQWYIEIEISKEDKKRLTDLGLKVKTNVDEDDNITYTFKATRKEARRKGKQVVGKNPAPVVVDHALTPFRDIIGQGSEVLLVFKPYSWSFKDNKGMSADFQKLQVINLIPYVPKGEDGEVVTSVDDGDDELAPVAAGGGPAPVQEAAPTTGDDSDIPF